MDMKPLHLAAISQFVFKLVEYNNTNLTQILRLIKDIKRQTFD